MGLGFKICEDTMALGRSIGDCIREPMLSLVFQGLVDHSERCAKEWWSDANFCPSGGSVKNRLLGSNGGSTESS